MNKAEIFYKDIGDYLSREEKLKIVSEGRSILNPALNMSQLKPNEHGKKEIQVYDYVDEKEPMLLKMYRRRLKGYKTLGFTIV